MDKTVLLGRAVDPQKDFSKELKTIIEKSHNAFEKQLNYISSGSLALSIVTIEKIIKDLTLTVHNWILITSWAFLILTLLSNLLSHLYSSKTHSKTITEITQGKYDKSKRLIRDKIINSWNLFSVALLIIGLFLQITFIAINLSHS